MVFGFSLLLAGVLVAWSLNWTSDSLAKDFGGAPQPSSLIQPAVPGSFADLAERLSPTVVNVKVTKVEQATFNRYQVPGGPFGDFFERFFKDMPQNPESRRIHGAGSGVIISADGYILTNNHVVEGAKEVLVTFADKGEFKAQVVGKDPKTDLAVLKITADKALPAAAMGDSEQLRVGDWVIAIGNPFGLNHTVTSGIVSAKGRVIGAGPYDDFIQTDASINPGNSGGPLFNIKGELVGINTAIIPQGQGIGFAIPVNTAKPLIPQLVTRGRVIRGYLGVTIQSMTPELAEALKVKDHKGALVADVVPGSPADKGGIKRGDVIVGYNSKAVEDSHDLPPMVAATPVGQEVTVIVLRDGKEHRLSMTVGKLAAEEGELETSAQPEKGKWGLRLQNLDPMISNELGLKTDKGVAVVGVEPGSPADQAGLQPGDVIVEVNRQPVSSVNEIKKRLDKSEDPDQVLLLVQRGEGKLFVPLERQG
jgi:serine protease Do